jgi:hypothetical protein
MGMLDKFTNGELMQTRARFRTARENKHYDVCYLPNVTPCMQAMLHEMYGIRPDEPRLDFAPCMTSVTYKERDDCIARLTAVIESRIIAAAMQPAAGVRRVEAWL